MHGTAVDDVHFHEVGAWDSIADVVGSCAALVDLGIDAVAAGAMALGSGTVRAAHGTVPVPVPAVLELCRDWQVVSGGNGELATPTGAALVTALATQTAGLPRLTVTSVGLGAGSRDRLDRANVVRAVVGTTGITATNDAEAGGSDQTSGGVAGATDAEEAPWHEPKCVLEANVDDLDPRLWPTVIDGLLAAGAADAWITPITMKRGRPAQLLSVLSAPTDVGALRDLIFASTSTIGVRATDATRWALARGWTDVRSWPAHRREGGPPRRPNRQRSSGVPLRRVGCSGPRVSGPGGPGRRRGGRRNRRLGERCARPRGTAEGAVTQGSCARRLGRRGSPWETRALREPRSARPGVRRRSRCRC